MYCIAGKREAILTAMSEHYPYSSFPVLQDNIIPHPFNLDDELNAINKHHRRQRRMSPCCDDRYVLFVLDTSGSIGRTTFTKMVNSLSQLVTLFCKNTRIAAITFGRDIYHEFCFNCFENDNPLRTNLISAISSIPYHGGSTHTGRALKCTCDEILTTECGLPSAEKYKECPAPIDVVVLTDGRSNGPLDVCETAKCLHDHPLYDVNTFAIGVDNFDQAEMDCIVNQNDLNVKNIFYLESFDEFELLINKTVTYLLTPGPNGDYRTCYNPNKQL